MHKKIQILHVITNISDGGLEKIVYFIASQVRNEKIVHNVAVLTKHENGFLFSKFQELGIKIVSLNLENKKGLISSIFINIKETLKLAFLIRKLRISIVHTHDFFPAFVSRIAVLISWLALFYKPEKVIVTLHNIFFWLKPVHHKVNKILSSFTTKIICVSNSVCEYSKIHDKIKNEKYEIIYNGVVVEDYTPNQNERDRYICELGYNKDNFLIGNVGVLSVRKGQKYLLKAFKKINEIYPGSRLLIFGSERQHELEIRNELYEIIKNNKLEDTVRIYSPREDLNTIYNLFDLFVMPSISEGMSLSAMEALLMERMCLFSDIKPFEEMVEHGEKQNAFLFKSEDENDLFEKMNYIIKNYDKLSNIKVNARKQALKKYNVRDMAKNYENLYLS